MVKEVSFAASFVQRANTKTVPPSTANESSLSGVFSYQNV